MEHPFLLHNVEEITEPSLLRKPVVREYRLRTPRVRRHRRKAEPCPPQRGKMPEQRQGPRTFLRRERPAAARVTRERGQRRRFRRRGRIRAAWGPEFPRSLRALRSLPPRKTRPSEYPALRSEPLWSAPPILRDTPFLQQKSCCRMWPERPPGPRKRRTLPERRLYRKCRAFLRPERSAPRPAASRSAPQKRRVRQKPRSFPQKAQRKQRREIPHSFRRVQKKQRKQGKRPSYPFPRPEPGLPERRPHAC